jgi:hypothetical protein
MSDEINTIADEYIDKFDVADITLIKITDNRYTRMDLRETLISRIRERGLEKIICYTFMNELYLEKL